MAKDATQMVLQERNCAVSSRRWTVPQRRSGDFTKANFTNAKMQETKLQRTVLKNANLTNANLWRSMITGRSRCGYRSDAEEVGIQDVADLALCSTKKLPTTAFAFLS